MDADELKQKVCNSNINCYSGDFAKNYDLNNSGYKQKIIQKNMNEIISKSKKDLAMIEIACGTGRTTHKFFRYQKLKKIFCLDISKDMLEVLKKKLSNKERKRAEFICEEATDFFKNTNKKFDIILIEGSLHHILDYEKLLDYSSKKLKPAGFYCIFGEPTPKEEFNFYVEEIISTWDRAINEFKDKPLKRILYLLYSPLSILSLFLNKGSVKKLKDRILHGKAFDEDLIKYAEYWVYEGKTGLNKNKIIEVLKKNKIEIIKIGPYPGYKSEFINKLSKFLKINVCFYIIGRKK